MLVTCFGRAALRVLLCFTVASGLLIASCGRGAREASSAGTATPAPAQAGSARAFPASPAVPSSATPNSPPVFLWRTQSETAVVHLLGSIHVATKDMYPLDERIERAFAESDTLVLELSLDEEAQAEAAQLMMAAALLPKGRDLWPLLDAPTQSLLRQKLMKLNVDTASVDSFKPWFVGITIALLEVERAGFSHEYGVDRYFYERARGKKRLLALETATEQLAAFEVLEEDGDSQSLKLSLEVDSATQVRQMLKIWQAGDAQALDALLDETRAFPKAFEALFTQRNVKMAERISSYLQTTGRYFVVVGAGHMVGSGSIIDLLRQRGHAVERR